MAKSNSSTEAVVSDLLAERNKYQTWISRLESTKDTTPAAVRSKVQADYQAKLEAVLARLAEHGDAVREQLENKKVRKEELVGEETKAKETLAEAELRHAVGEYDEGDWTKVRAEMNKVLVGTREELAKVIEDIERLAEVAKLIAAPPAPPPAPAPEPKPEPKPEPVKAEAPKAAPAEPARRDSGRVEFVAPDAKAKPPADELEFLRATVGEAAEAPVPPAPAAKPAKSEKKAKAEPIAAPTEPAEPVAELPSPRSSSENRTLKCPECGTMNRATEWYCERCGNELAGV